MVARTMPLPKTRLAMTEQLVLVRRLRVQAVRTWANIVQNILSLWSLRVEFHAQQ